MSYSQNLLKQTTNLFHTGGGGCADPGSAFALHNKYTKQMEDYITS